MKYYTVRLQARNRMGQGQQWEKQLVAVSADDSKSVCTLERRLLYVFVVACVMKTSFVRTLLKTTFGCQC